MSKKRSKPKNPEQIAAEKRRARAQDFGALNMQPEAANLPANESIEVRRESRQSLAGARRLDVFEALRAKTKAKPKSNDPPALDAASYAAARKLEADMREQRGEFDRGRNLHRVDETQDSEGGYMDRRIAAAERVEAALKRVGDRDAYLLTQLIYPTIPCDHWRKIVFYVTGETNPHAQAAAVRSACANLAGSDRPAHHVKAALWTDRENWKTGVTEAA